MIRNAKSRGTLRALALTAMAIALMTPVAAGGEPAPTPDPLGDFTHVAGTDSEPGGLEWVAVPFDEAEIPSRRYELTAWSGGFAFLERPQGPGANSQAVWTSADGLDWTRTALPDSIKEPFWLEPYRGGLVLASEQRRGYRAHDTKMDFWRSSDGIEWQLNGTLEATVPRSQPELAYWPLALFPFAERMTMIAIGVPRNASGGRAGDGVEFVAAERRPAVVPSDVARVWTSKGGSSWRERRLRGLADGSGQLYDTEAFTGPGAAWISRDGEAGALMTSADGITWRRAAALPAHFDGGAPVAMLWARDALLLLGDNDDRDGAEGCGNRLGVWRLDEARKTWAEVLDRQPAFVHGAAAEGEWVILAGRSWCPGDWAWTLVSRDGGQSWDPGLSWTGGHGTCLGQVAIHDGTVVAFACGRAIEAGPLAWVASLPPDPEPDL